MLLNNRHGSVDSDAYRYGFQGQERDDEIKGEGNSYNYKYRMHDPRLGRFFAVDPLSHEFAWNSPYTFAENKLGLGKELEGLELDWSARYQGYFELTNKMGLSHEEAQDQMSKGFIVGTALAGTIVIDATITKGAISKELFKQFLIGSGAAAVDDIIKRKTFDSETITNSLGSSLIAVDLGDAFIDVTLDRFKLGKLKTVLETVTPSLIDITYENNIQVVGVNKDAGSVLKDALGNFIADQSKGVLPKGGKWTDSEVFQGLVDVMLAEVTKLISSMNAELTNQKNNTTQKLLQKKQDNTLYNNPRNYRLKNLIKSPDDSKEKQSNQAPTQGSNLEFKQG
ncbi:RHS repeat domain-containing protein [Nonlabens sp.]|uniref:RHS repeat domain-containing protein n=1 Tax=Nonlabens sp. TaxID=1888209 RepID=UPI003F69A1FC